jgi:hypothetical protein
MKTKTIACNILLDGRLDAVLKNVANEKRMSKSKLMRLCALDYLQRNHDTTLTDTIAHL